MCVDRATAQSDVDDEGIMDQGFTALRDSSGKPARRPTAKAGRRSRPMTRMQEFTLLAVLFATGVALQAAFVLDFAPATP
jgi:hypothetical protein